MRASRPARMTATAARAYAGAMDDTDELGRLAERYLDLWERQAMLMSGAPAGPEAFAAWIAALGASAVGGGQADDGGTADDRHPG